MLDIVTCIAFRENRFFIFRIRRDNVSGRRRKWPIIKIKKTATFARFESIILYIEEKKSSNDILYIYI